MRLLADGTVELTEFGRPACFAEEWRRLLSQLAACRTLTDLRIYDYDGDEPPMAAAPYHLWPPAALRQCRGICPGCRVAGCCPCFLGYRWLRRPLRDEMFRAVGALSAWMASGRSRKQSVRRCRGIAVRWPICCKKNGTVTLFDRKNRFHPAPAERCKKIALVRYNPYGVSTWVALSKITGRFFVQQSPAIPSRPISSAGITDIIAPNRFRQKIADFAAVPRRYLAVLYQNGYLRVFGSGYPAGISSARMSGVLSWRGRSSSPIFPPIFPYAPRHRCGGGRRRAIPFPRRKASSHWASRWIFRPFSPCCGSGWRVGAGLKNWRPCRQKAGAGHPPQRKIHLLPVPGWHRGSRPA